LAFTVKFHVEDGGVESFLAQGMEDFVVVKLNAQGIGCTAVDNGGNTASVAQAAARTRTLIATRSGVEFHEELQLHLGLHGLQGSTDPVGKRGAILRRERLLPAATSRQRVY